MISSGVASAVSEATSIRLASSVADDAPRSVKARNSSKRARKRLLIRSGAAIRTSCPRGVVRKWPRRVDATNPAFARYVFAQCTRLAKMVWRPEERRALRADAAKRWYHARLTLK